MTPPGICVSKIKCVCKCDTVYAWCGVCVYVWCCVCVMLCVWCRCDAIYVCVCCTVCDVCDVVCVSDGVCVYVMLCGMQDVYVCVVQSICMWYRTYVCVCVCVCDAVYVCLWCSMSDVVCVCNREWVYLLAEGMPREPWLPSPAFILWSLLACPLGFSRASQSPREQHIALRLPCLPEQACHSGSVSSTTEAVTDVLITVLMQKQAFPACHPRGLSL